MMKSQAKLAFLGDITCDRPMLKAARSNGSYNFVKSLEGIKPMVSDCDIVVANLETVFAGAKKGYNPSPISYNSPDELCAGIKAAGIMLLTTANNHCLDMGRRGIDRTNRLLAHYGFEHTGTVSSGDEYKTRYNIKSVNGIRIAFVALTDGLNIRADGSYHDLAEWQQVNNLRARETGAKENPFKKVLKRVLPMNFIKQCQAQIKRIRGIPLVTPKVDNQPITDADRKQILWAINLLKEAKSNANYVVACIHSGGQFNPEPGTHCSQLYDLLEPYCDAIIGNHPHVVQRMEVHDGKIRAYSLGSVNMSSSADYVSSDTDFAYSAILKITLMKNKDAVEVIDIEHELLHAEETKDHYVIVHRSEKNETSDEVMRRLSDDGRRQSLL